MGNLFSAFLGNYISVRTAGTKLKFKIEHWTDNDMHNIADKFNENGNRLYELHQKLTLEIRKLFNKT